MRSCAQVVFSFLGEWKMNGHFLFLLELDSPWDYLNGTSSVTDFGIDAGNADGVLIAVFNLGWRILFFICGILLLASLLSMLTSLNPQDVAQAKKGLKDRTGVLLLLAGITGILSALMGACNYFFGIV